GILITTIASKGELQNWPDLLPKLCSLLDSEDYNTCEGAFGALQKICEDSAEILDSDALDRPLNIMIPKFLQFFKHSSPKISPSRQGCSQFILCPACTCAWDCPAQVQDLELGLAELHEVHTDPPFKPVRVPLDGISSLQCVNRTIQLGVVSKQISKELLDFAGRNDVSNQKIQDCILIVSLIFLGKLLLGIFSTKDSSSEFFVKLIPVLVNGMKYSEIDIILLKGDVEEDEAIPDSEQDIRPRFHRSRTVAQPHEEDRIEDDDDDDDDNDLDDDDTISDWNLS
ncbi:TNPO1 protein, partial [Picathartes gymnocephalus]|nr:TNPO1 protein [Picathartes gymnocephalus]